MRDLNSETPRPLDYATPQPRKKWAKTSRAFWPVLLTCAGFTLLIIVIMPVSRHSSRNYSEISKKEKCLCNLHQIGLGILRYQQDHGGTSPSTLDEVLEEQIGAEAFVCPASNDTCSTAPTTQGIAADFHAGGHLSYIYIGQGFTDKTTPANAIIAYEPLANHGDGICVLCGDGHTEFIDKTRAAKVLKAAASAPRPVLLPP